VLAALGETWPPGYPDAASTCGPLGRMRLADRPICTQAVEMPRPSADGRCQADNDIDGHDLLQFPDSSGVVGPRGTSAGEPVSAARRTP